MKVNFKHWGLEQLISYKATLEAYGTEKELYEIQAEIDKRKREEEDSRNNANSND